jgi:hypothetical protein
MLASGAMIHLLLRILHHDNPRFRDAGENAFCGVLLLRFALPPFMTPFNCWAAFPLHISPQCARSPVWRFLFRSQFTETC